MMSMMNRVSTSTKAFAIAPLMGATLLLVIALPPRS